MTAITRPTSSTVDVGDGGLRLVLRAIRVGPALILLLLCLILTLVTPFFLTGDNLKNLLVQGAPLAALAVGQLFVILVGGIDLSVGSLIALTTVTGSLAFHHIGGGVVTILAMLLTGLAVGFVNASATSRGGCRTRSSRPWGCSMRQRPGPSAVRRPTDDPGGDHRKGASFWRRGFVSGAVRGARSALHRHHKRLNLLPVTSLFDLLSATHRVIASLSELRSCRRKLKSASARMQAGR